VTTLLDGSVLIVGGYTYDAKMVPTYLAKAYRYLPASDTVVEAGALKKARASHSATRLADGRVLVIGGVDEVDYLVSSEIFDPAKPAATAWSAGPDLAEQRLGHLTLLLPSGEVLVSGGGVGLSTNATNVFYQPSGSWKLGLATMKKARRYHAGVVLTNGKVLFVGGEQEGKPTVRHDDLEVLDLQSGAGTTLKMTRARSFPSATLLADGRVLIAGGYCQGCTGSDSDELYDPKIDAISLIPHPGGVLWTYVAARLLDGRVLIISDETVVAFNPGGSAPGWDVLPSLAQPHRSGVGAALLDGTVLVVGGLDKLDTEISDKLERFFP
jgi:hypothetical protein